MSTARSEADFVASPFGRLYKVIGDPARLEKAYDSVLRELFENPFWSSGPSTLQRVLWTDGPRARIEDRTAFGSPGLYLWGAKKRPLYLGITRGTLDRRFYRYIWGYRSQCSLAREFGGELRPNGFPVEVRDWYSERFGNSTVRLRGAERFAQEGIDNIWFALFPHHGVGQIRGLERALVHRDSGAAVKWNRDHRMPMLLNKQN